MNELRQALLPGEEILFATRKHWLAPIRDSLVAILLIVGAALLWWLSPDGEGFFGSVGGLMDLVGWGLILVAIAWIIGNIVAWLSANYGVSNLRVLCYEGIVRKHSSETLLSSISDVKLTVPALGGLLGYGDLIILTASGVEGSDTFTTIKGAGAFRTALQSEQSRPRAAAAAATSAAPTPAPAPSPEPAPVAPVATPVPAPTDAAASLERLAALHAQGVITDAEFEAKKAELLGRI